ncbi:hypothetical protein Hanom_Chr03g00264271 [Helianthus anomalus]
MDLKKMKKKKSDGARVFFFAIGIGIGLLALATVVKVRRICAVVAIDEYGVHGAFVIPGFFIYFSLHALIKIILLSFL